MWTSHKHKTAQGALFLVYKLYDIFYNQSYLDLFAKVLEVTC